MYFANYNRAITVCLDNTYIYMYFVWLCIVKYNVCYTIRYFKKLPYTLEPTIKTF